MNIDHHPTPTCLRNHAFIQEVMAGGGPIHMVTKEAFQDPHLETVGGENFLGMTVGQAVVWASQNIDPKYTNPELTTSEPYVMGSQLVQAHGLVVQKIWLRQNIFGATIE